MNVQILTCIIAYTYLRMLKHEFCTFAGLTAIVGPVAFALAVTSAVALLMSGIGGGPGCGHWCSSS